MGHLRLGRLPKTRRWLAVMDLLDTAPFDTANVARAVVEAADPRLSTLVHDPSLVYSFWMLTRIAWASRGSDFVIALRHLGLHLDGDSTVFALISQLSDQVRTTTAAQTASGPFGELASLALRHALSETVGAQGTGLFGATVGDVQAAFRLYSSRAQFGLLAKRFFGDFFARTLRYFVDKEVSNHIGAHHTLQNVDQSHEFDRALDLYARQSARIMEDFASGWYSKHNWQSHGEITPTEAQGFVRVALRKLRMELTREVGQA
jgi:hypothetical protein